MRAYVEILRLPGALRFSLAGLLARSGGAMMAIGHLMMVSALYGNYTWAGALSAANGAAWAIGAAILASRVDRLGQRRVMWPAVIVSGLALAVVVGLALARAPVGALLPGAIVSGFFGGSPGAMVRARWSHATANAHQLHTAYSLESTFDELTFVVGPVVVTLLSTQVHPAAGLVAPIIVGLLGGYLFYSQRATEPPVAAPSHAAAGPAPTVPTVPTRLRTWAGRLVLLVPGVGPLVAVNVFLGCFFGANDVSVVAATSAWGVRPWSGVVLAVFSLGSAVAGFAYGSRAWRSPLVRRFLLLIVATLVTGSALLVVPNAAWLAVAGFFIGATIAPSLINSNALITATVPRDRLTEGLAWLGTSLGLGAALGSSLAGRVIDLAGHVGGFRLTVAFAALATGIALASAGVVRRALATTAGRRVGPPATT